MSRGGTRPRIHSSSHFLLWCPFPCDLRLTPEAVARDPGTQAQNMLLDTLKLLHLASGPQALVSPTDAGYGTLTLRG